jgi:hypothetical protein
MKNSKFKAPTSRKWGKLKPEMGERGDERGGLLQACYWALFNFTKTSLVRAALPATS